MPVDRTSALRRRTSAVVLLGATLVVSACATRVAHERIRLAAGLDGPSAVAQPQAVAAQPTGPVAPAATLPTAGPAASSAAVAPLPSGPNPAVSAPAQQPTTAVVAPGRTAASVVKSQAVASTKPSGAPVAPATNGPATGSVINLGVVGTFSGAVGAFVSDIVNGIKVWQQWINNHGGVNGHPVNVIVGDDGGDPAKYNSLVQQDVTQNHVVAFLFNTLGFAPNGNNSYLDGQRILTFGTETGLDAAYTDPWVLTPLATGHQHAQAIIYGAAKVAVPQGKTKLATLACSDFSLCDLFDSTWADPSVLKATGFTNVYRSRPSLTQPDFTAQCLSAQQAGAQVMVLAMDTASDQRISDSCARQNYHPIFAVPDLLALPGLLSDSNLDGAVVTSKMAPFVDTDIAGIAQFRQAYAKYAPSLSPNSGSAATGWLYGQFFAAAGANLPANPTPADVLSGLHKLKNNNLDGMTYPLDFSASQQSQRHTCFGVAQVKNKAYVAVPGVTGLQCIS